MRSRFWGDLASCGKRKMDLGAGDLTALTFLCDRVLTAPPLVITPSCLLSWVVFTDGACEGAEGQKKGGIGGVLSERQGRVEAFFGGEVPDGIMSSFLAKSRNRIYELPVLISIWMWGSRLTRSQVCWYLDNEASRSAFIKGQGATLLADSMVGAFGDDVHGFPDLDAGMKRDAFLVTWEDKFQGNSGNFNSVAWTGDMAYRSLAVHDFVQSDAGNVNDRWNNNLKGVRSLEVDNFQCCSGNIDRCNQFQCNSGHFHMCDFIQSNAGNFDMFNLIQCYAGTFNMGNHMQSNSGNVYPNFGIRCRSCAANLVRWWMFQQHMYTGVCNAVQSQADELDARMCGSTVDVLEVWSGAMQQK